MSEKYSVKTIDGERSTICVVYRHPDNASVTLMKELKLPASVLQALDPAVAVSEYILSVYPTDELNAVASAEPIGLDILLKINAPDQIIPVNPEPPEQPESPPVVESSPLDGFSEAKKSAIRAVLKKGAAFREMRWGEKGVPRTLFVSSIFRIMECIKAMETLDTLADIPEPELRNRFPALYAEATWRGVSIIKIVLEIEKDVRSMAEMEGMIKGIEKKLIGEIESVAFGDTDALMDLDIESEWPDL